MRPVLSPRKIARKKNRKKVDRTKTRLQPIQGTPELAEALIAGEDTEIIDVTVSLESDPVEEMEQDGLRESEEKPGDDFVDPNPPDDDLPEDPEDDDEEVEEAEDDGD